MNDLCTHHSVDIVDPQVENVHFWLAAIVNSSDDVIISKNLDGVISTWNPAAQRLFGYSEQEAVGQPITIIIPPELHHEEKEILSRLRSGQRIEHYETHRMTRDGRWMDVAITISPVRDAGGTIIGASKILRDITERKRAQAALRESEERFRRIANTAPVVIWMTDINKQFAYVNQAWRDFTGLPASAALGKRWTDGMHPDDVERSWDTYAKAFDRREAFQLESRIRSCNGEYRWVFCAGVPRYDGDGAFVGYIGSAMDVTERKLAEEALSSVSRRLIHAQELERARLARELHDDISQRLAVLNLHLTALTQDAPASANESRCGIQKVREQVVSLIEDVQTLAHRLHPQWLEYLGISAAAAALCSEISGQQGIEVSFHEENVPGRLAKRVAVCLYRVLQEALQNAIKHSGARKVEVSLRGVLDRVELTVHDFGVGFDVTTMHGRGLGLTNMKERLKDVDGQLAIRSGPQRGTLIRARVPKVRR